MGGGERGEREGRGAKLLLFVFISCVKLRVMQWQVVVVIVVVFMNRVMNVGIHFLRL